MQSYQNLSRYYDLLMEDARYPERAGYILEICKRFSHEPGQICDLCCGTGSLTRKLKKGGRIVILTFQSLEDRAVKEAMKYMENPCTCPKSFPVCVCGKKREVKIITNKPIVATNEEVERNSRSKCAKLRIAERI